MNIQTPKPQRTPVWLNADSGDFETFREIVGQTANPADTPHAAQVIRNIPIYEGASVDAASADPATRQAMMEEWADVFAHGAGIIVIRQGLADHAVIDRASIVFDQIIADEKQAAKGGGDHFAKPGANDRIWNSLEKHCLADPANFAAYFSSQGIAMAAEAWLGPASQMTAQVNRVNPGGAAQTPHRDYHLGFMSATRMAQFPAHIHAVSPTLTLQGAVAHCDMPVETGPTMLLPFSQQFYEGYLAFSRPEFQAYFAANYVQLPLHKGDLVFFNPAVMHGAGTNHTTDRFRMVNLLQVSSAFGRAMETVNRTRMLRALYPAIRTARGLNIANVIAASAEGYPFPTNLDSNPPVGGLAPKTQADFLREALAQDQGEDAFFGLLDALDAKNRS
ncbi:MAG: phytanoyl-CoA dioxygenase family protein [Pseudotabrizicola sp.]|uniref:phytanoyl-CoA dioxygenase family protein n=1 Tax=Pseudotabrizicola sp. TaxID=2939647 RepID=UPI002730D931|nr:phytanoyl-CoA dioxygenase family protein [Pseudotabrizicola sp.]MDP2079596.1 phytanoyl-CoA dioxygenase family protein [Pseudotabrizicola sp.]MDZ7576365.1 phytanoyl-CoA dioxygenase family protein [Pseudotabrizicola sp.]